MERPGVKEVVVTPRLIEGTDGLSRKNFKYIELFTLGKISTFHHKILVHNKNNNYSVSYILYR